MSAERPGSTAERIAAIRAVANRAGYIWLSRRWPSDDAALDAVIALGILARPPRRPGTLGDAERLARIRASAERAAARLSRLATCPAMDDGQRAEVATIAAALAEAARA
jgi:hypothetical protein